MQPGGSPASHKCVNRELLVAERQLGLARVLGDLKNIGFAAGRTHLSDGAPLMRHRKKAMLV